MSNKIHRVKRTRSTAGEETETLQKLQAKVIELQDENRQFRKLLANYREIISEYEDELEVEDSVLDEDDEDEEDEDE